MIKREALDDIFNTWGALVSGCAYGWDDDCQSMIPRRAQLDSALDALYDRLHRLEEFARAHLTVDALIDTFCDDVDLYNQKVEEARNARAALPRDLYNHLLQDEGPTPQDR